MELGEKRKVSQREQRRIVISAGTHDLLKELAKNLRSTIETVVHHALKDLWFSAGYNEEEYRKIASGSLFAKLTDEERFQLMEELAEVGFISIDGVKKKSAIASRFSPDELMDIIDEANSYGALESKADLCQSRASQRFLTYEFLREMKRSSSAKKIIRTK